MWFAKKIHLAKNITKKESHPYKESAAADFGKLLSIRLR